MHRIAVRTACLAFALTQSFLFAGPANAAGLFRAYLAGNGNDMNPCTLQAPCRLLPAALAAIGDGGEVWIMDSANFNVGPVTINKSASILAIPGAQGSVIGNGGSGLVINGTGVRVELRNLTIVNFSGGAYGVHFQAGAALLVESCKIHGFTGGISINAPADVAIVSSQVFDNGDGILLDNGAKATISRSHVLRNAGAGIAVAPTVASTATAYISDTVANSNSYGIIAYGNPSKIAKAFVSRTEASGNSVSGFQTGGYGQALMVVSNSVATGNAFGVANVAGILRATGTNLVTENTSANTTGPIDFQPLF